MDTNPSAPDLKPIIDRVSKMTQDHPEATVLVSTGIGVVAGVLLSSLIESDSTMQRGRASRFAHRLGQQLLDSTEEVVNPTLSSLRDLFKG